MKTPSQSSRHGGEYLPVLKPGNNTLAHESTSLSGTNPRVDIQQLDHGERHPAAHWQKLQTSLSKCATELMKNCLNRLVPSIFRCRPWSFTANSSRLGFPNLIKGLKVCRRRTFLSLQRWTRLLFTALTLSTGPSATLLALNALSPKEKLSLGRGRMQDITSWALLFLRGC